MAKDSLQWNNYGNMRSNILLHILNIWLLYFLKVTQRCHVITNEDYKHMICNSTLHLTLNIEIRLISFFSTSSNPYSTMTSWTQKDPRRFFRKGDLMPFHFLCCTRSESYRMALFFWTLQRLSSCKSVSNGLGSCPWTSFVTFGVWCTLLRFWALFCHAQ